MKKSFLDRAAAFAIAFVLTVGGGLQNFAASAFAEEIGSEPAVIETEPAAAEPETVQEETHTEIDETGDVAANDGILSQSDVTVVDSGVCGDNATWTLDDNGTLTISGFGKMWDYPQHGSDGFGSYLSHVITVVIEDGITSIGVSSFSDFINLRKITIPDSVTEIGHNAFLKCSSLKNIILPDGLTSIAVGTFDRCRNLTNVIIPDSVTSIGVDAFMYCNLESIIIPNSVTSIGSEAFCGCSHLTSISIPTSVTSINSFAFWQCSNLKHIHIPSDKTYSDYAGRGDLPTEPSYYFPGGCGDSDCPLYANGEIPDKPIDPDEKIYHDGDTITLEGSISYYGNYPYGTGEDAPTGDWYVLDIDDPISYFDPYRNTVCYCNNILFQDKVDDTCKPFPSEDVVAANGKKVSVIARLSIWAEGLYALKPVLYDYKITWDIPPQKTYKIKWYNGETLLETQECPEKTIPEFKGTVPSCYDDEYGLKREFLGWTTQNNGDYDIHIPEIPGYVTSDTVYYAVFSAKEPEVDASDEDIDKIEYIYEHMEYAKYKQWDLDGVEYANDFRYYYQNGASETAHYIWRTVQMTDKAVNLDILGIKDEIRANDYNAIMLDMFNSIEGYETKSSFVDEAELEGWKDFEDIVLGWLKYSFSGQIKYETEVRKALKQFKKDKDGTKIMETLEKICDETGTDLHELVLPDWLANMYGLSDKVFGKIDLAYNTITDVIEKSDEIVSYRMYKHMSDEYRDILVEIYRKADSISGSDWEVKHLKEAIAYALNYYYNNEEQAVYDFMKNIVGKNVYNLGLKKTVQDFFKKGSEKFMDKALASETVAGSAKPNSSLIIAAIQNGFKFGVKISDFLFDQSNREDMYVKVKEYGVLSETLQMVLDDRASSLLKSTTIDGQYDESKRFDKAFKMFMYIESAASDNIADYEKSFEVLERVEIANTALVGPVFSLITNNQLEKDAARHVRNAALFADHAKFMRTLKCHTDGGLNLDEKILLSSYGGILKEHKIIIVSCPVQMNVYDENHVLVGSLSKGISNVTTGYEDYIYRIEETDSCVACVPIEYTVEIIGLDDGTMKVIGSYYNGEKQESTFSYNNVPINSGYSSTVTVNADTLELVTESDSPLNPSKPTKPNTPTAPSIPTQSAPSSPSFSIDPVTTSGKSHTRQKLTLKAETTPNSIKLSWSKISGAKKYTVYIYRNGRYEKLKDTAGTSFVFKNPVHGKTYRFLVRYSANGRPSSEMFSGKVTVTVYIKPAVTAHSGKNSIKLSWKPVSGAEKYAVYRYKNGRGSKIIETEDTYAVIKNLKSGAKYSYVVRAYVGGKWTPMTRSDIITATAE